jgi:hypothetical protein
MLTFMGVSVPDVRETALTIEDVAGVAAGMGRVTVELVLMVLWRW